MVIKNKLKGFIIVLLLFALGCEADTYSTNREEFGTEVTTDRKAPTVSLRAALIKNTENAVVQSTEKGSVYLVRTTVAVSTPASIKAAADNHWNSVNIIFVDTNTDLPATGLADGTYKAYAEDPTGNISKPSTNSVTIDSTAPTANLTAVTDDVGNITGALTSGDYTDDTALVLSGTNESGSVVIVYDGTTELGYATVSGTSWSYTATVVNGTTYQFNVKETDLVGNTSDATSNFTVTGDTTRPSVTLNAGNLNASDSAVVQSTETGTVYLIRESVNVSNLASITGAADNLWNSVTISTPSTNTSLPVTGLINGTYEAYAVDYAGNLSSESSNSVIIDSTIPTITNVAISSASVKQNNLLNAGDNVSVTVTFSESVLVASGTPTLTLVVGSTNQTAIYDAEDNGTNQIVFQYTIQAGETDSDGISIGANALARPGSSTIRDAFGNDANLDHDPVTHNAEYKVDTTAPFVSSFTLDDTELTVGETATVTLVFSDTVLEFSSSADIDVANLDNGSASGTLSTMTSSDNITWTGTFTPTANTEDDTNYLELEKEKYTDLAGNTGATDNRTANFVINTLGPTISSVAITSSSGKQNNFLNAGDNVSMTVNFSETVILDNTGGPPVLTIVVGSTDRPTTFISGSNSDNLTFRYTIQAGENDTDGISISADALELPSGSTLKDSSGNLASVEHDAVTHNAEYKVDTTTPSVSSFTMSDTEIKIGDTPTVTLAFSEAVIGFSSSADITIASLDNGTASGSLSTMSSTDNESWTGTFTPTANTEDATNTLSLAINSYTDLAGNNGPAATTANYEIDTLAPTVDNFTMSDTELKVGDTATVTLTFSEAVIGFSNADITIASLDNGTSTGTLSTMTSTDNESWTGTFTPTDDIEDNTSVLTLGTSYTDLAGNTGPTEQTSNYEVDTREPTVNTIAITAQSGKQNNFLNPNDNVSFTVSFSETVIVDNSSGLSLTFLMGSENRTAQYKSGSGNAQQVFGYTIDDLLTSGENDSDGLSTGSNPIVLPGGSTIKDLAGNTAILDHAGMSTDTDHKVDTIPPTEVSTGIDNATTTGLQNNFLNAGDVLSLKSNFSETVLKESASLTYKIVVGSDNKTATYSSGTNSDNLMFQYQIQAGDNDTDGISIDQNDIIGTITDLAGNIASDVTINALTDNSSYKVDTTAPSVDNFTMSDTALKIGDNATVTLIFSEQICPVTDSCAIGFNNSDIDVPDVTGTFTDTGSLSTLTTDDNVTWTGIFIPTDNIEDNTSVLTLGTGYTDLAGNAGPSAQTANYAVDTKEPEVSRVFVSGQQGISAYNFLNPNDNVSLTARFTETVVVDNSFGGAPSLTFIMGSDNRTATFTSGSNSVDLVFGYTIGALYTPGENDSDGISTGADAVVVPDNRTIKDLAGNTAILDHNAMSTDVNYKVDTIPPNLGSVGIISGSCIQNNFLKPDATVTTRAYFSEDVLLVSGSPTLPIVVGSSERDNSTYSSGHTSANFNFTYRILPLLASGENDDDGISINQNAFSLNSAVITDKADNVADNISHSAVPDNESFKVDTIPPAVSSFTMDDVEVRIGDRPLVTLEFSEPISPDDSSCGVEGLTNGDITVPNGLLSNGASTAVGDLSTLSTSDNETWTSTFTPEDDIEDDTNQLELRDGTYTDLAGNEGPAAQTANFLVDTRRPTAEFYMDDRHLKFGDNMTLYLEFSEPVMEFSNADITIPNLNQSPRHDGSVTSGTLSTMTLQSDNKTWVGIFVPTFPTTEDWTNTFTLGTDWKDLDNNTGTAATSPNYMIDDIPPSANGSTTITIQTNNSANDSLILYGQSATVTVTFPEPVNKYWGGNVNKNESNNDVNDCNDDSTTATLNFDATDLDLDNATGTSSTITNGSFNGSDCNDTTWTATYTPPDDVEFPVNTITVKNTWYDQVGNQGVDNVTSVFDVETYRPRAVLTITHNHSDNFTCGNYHSNCNNKHGFRPGDNGTLTVTFTDLEPDIGIYGFTTSDITVPSYVNLSTMTITDSDNTTWSGTFTPIDNTTGGSGQSGSYNIRFGLPYNTYKDFKGNDGYATRYSPYFIADTKAPYVNFVELVHDGEEVTATNGMCMPIESNIKVNFDYIMEPNYIDTTTSGSNCAGSVNLSSDDISTCSPSSSCSCVTMTSEPTTPSSGSYQNIEYTLNPTDNLSSSTSYKVWVTTRARDALGNTFTSDHIHHELKSSAILPASDAEVFFAVAQSGKIFRSGDNGASWDNETCFTFKQLNGVAYGSNTFVAVGNSGRIERTTDNGVSWDTENTSGYNIFGIAFGQSKFIGVGDANRILRSTDSGASWNSYIGPYYNWYSSSRDLNGVAFGNNTFVAVGDSSKIITSTNPGTSRYSWSMRCNGVHSCFSSGTNNLNGVAFGNGTFVAVGVSGRIMISSDNGQTWSSTNSSGSTLNGVAYGNGAFVAVGASGSILRSSNNGASWSAASSGVSTELNGVAFGNSTFVAVGASGTIITSSNGSSWTTRTSGTTNTLNGVTFGE